MIAVNSKGSMHLPVLCPQSYDGMEMIVVTCSRCRQWVKSEGRCSVYTGAEHLPLVDASEVPECPLQSRCQHEIQAAPSPCPVRSRGMVCESALRFSGVPNPEDDPRSFHADLVATPEEWHARAEETRR